MPLGFIASVAAYRISRLSRARCGARAGSGSSARRCIHPGQVPIVNQEFSPGADEVASARSIVEAYDEAVAAGRGSIEVDGKMIDVPVVLRAQELLGDPRRDPATASRARRWTISAYFPLAR